MKVKKIFFLILILSLCASSAYSRAKLEITQQPESVQQYEPFILKLNLPFFDKNPNDSVNAQVNAVITTPEKGSVIMPFFCRNNKKPAGKSKWEMRFTPSREGKYQYYIEAEGGDFKAKTRTFEFEVIKGEGKGFLRRSSNNPYYLKFASGTPFFGIGHNVAWVGNSSLVIFERYFSLLVKAGCNLTRVWMCNWGLPLEWKELGKYNSDTAKRLDELLDIAKKKDLYIILCIDTYSNLMPEAGHWAEERWDANPYNKEKGGPCEKPEDFFTHPEAKHIYKNRLRYIISRWSYSPNILAFEFWNEYNAPSEWVKEMSEYVKSIDPHGHLLTTSHGYPYGQLFDESKIWKLKDIDIITFHEYGSGAEGDLVTRLLQRSRGLAKLYKKPFLASEFGIDFGKDDKNYDPKGDGTALHNSLWASCMSKAFGSAMNWWYDTYIRPRNLYYHYSALAKFAKGINWDAKDIEYMDLSSVRVKLPEGEEPSYSSVEIKPKDQWGKIDITEFEVLENGDLTGGGMPTKYLHGYKKEEIKDDHVFYLNYPKDGKFILRIGTVSQGGNLEVYLDGEKIAEKEYVVSPGEGPWKRSIYLEKHKVYQCIYDEDYEIPVPKGEHTLRLRNTGQDWIGIERIILTDYVDSSLAKARCVGLRVGDDYILWIQNKSSNWKNSYNNVKITPLKDAHLKIYNLEDGAYEVEWWDTRKGEVITDKEVTSSGKILKLHIPEFTRDIACKIKKK